MIAQNMKEVDLNFVGVKVEDRQKLLAQKLKGVILELSERVNLELESFLHQMDIPRSALQFDHSFVLWVEKSNLNVYVYAGVVRDEELHEAHIPVNMRMTHAVDWLLDPKF